MVRGLNNKGYDEAGDDIYKDLLTDLEVIKLDVDEEVGAGIDLAIELIVDKRRELYG